MQANEVREIATIPVIGWESVEAFFYRAMVKGWASGNEPVKNGFERSFTHREGQLQLIDKWWKVLGSNRSSGVTTIELRHTVNGASVWVPIWQMHYGGEYGKEASAFVKRVLLDAYRRPKGFHGCRGPSDMYVYEKDHSVYVNEVVATLEPPLPLRPFSVRPSFCSFKGMEKVTTKSMGCVGYHNYFGMSLI